MERQRNNCNEGAMEQERFHPCNYIPGTLQLNIIILSTELGAHVRPGELWINVEVFWAQNYYDRRTIN